MEVVLEAKDAGDWTYRGEGAANLVLAYTGSSPSFVCLFSSSYTFRIFTSLYYLFYLFVLRFR